MILLETVKVLTMSVLAFVLAFALTPILTKFLNRFGAEKQIRMTGTTPIYSQLHAKKVGTQTMGGVVIWGTVLILAAFFGVMGLLFDGLWGQLNFIDRAETYLPLAAMTIAGLLGLVDDIYGVMRVGPSGGGLRVSQKLVIYFLLAVVGAFWFYYRLDWDVLAIPFAEPVIIGWLYIPLFIFVIVASAFSANETDGLDGLAGGVMLFAFLALTVVAFVLGRFELAAFSGAIIGALLAFLWFNIHPARFFMGDTGSMSLGITMGVIAMLTNTTLLLPFFAFILVLESLSVIIQVASKKFRGKKVFLSAPIHHHYEALGWPETKVTMRFWIISAISTTLGLVIFFLSRYI